MDLREFLFRKNMSKRQLAEILGCNYQTICAWYNGRHFPMLPQAKKLIEYSKGLITLEDIYAKKVGLSTQRGINDE